MKAIHFYGTKEDGSIDVLTFIKGRVNHMKELAYLREQIANGTSQYVSHTFHEE